MIDAGCQEQAVFSVQTLFVGRITPGLAVACQEMIYIVHASDSATGFNPHNALLEKPLAAPCPHDRLPVCLVHRRIALNLLFQPLFPNVEIIACYGSSTFQDNTVCGASDQSARLFSD